MTTSELAEMGIIQLLADLFSGTVSLDIAPTQDMVKGEKERGVIKSAATKKLFAAYTALAEYDESGVLLNNPSEFLVKGTVLLEHKGILHRLLRQSIVEEFPQAIGHVKIPKDILGQLRFTETVGKNVEIRRDWRLYSKRDEWDETVLARNEGALAFNYIDRVADIVQGKYVSVHHQMLLDSDPGTFVGVLEDVRLQTLYCLPMAILVDLHEALPSIVKSKAKGKLDSSTVNCLKALFLLYNSIADITLELFWGGVHDLFNIPGSCLQIQRGWKVVQVLGRVDITPLPDVKMTIPFTGEKMRMAEGLVRAMATQ